MARGIEIDPGARKSFRARARLTIATRLWSPRQESDLTARQKLENLTHSWYGFAVFGAVCSLLDGGIGFFSLLRTSVGLFFSFLLTFFLGRRLLAKSSFWRFVLVVISGASMVFGSLGLARSGWHFLHDWSFGLLFEIGVALVTVVMNVKSFRVLTDSSVKSYFS